MEDSVVVIDVGSSSVKAGYSGEEIPSFIFPSVYTTWPKYTQLMESYPEGGVSSGGFQDSFHPIERGKVKDWDQLSKFCEVILEELNLTTSDATSVLLVESAYTTAQDREKWAEILFESYRIPSICFTNSSSACIYASGRTSGLSIDCGAGVTSCVPVYEGLPLKHAGVISDFGGQDITYNLQQLLAERRITVSFTDARVIKESRAFISSTSVETPQTPQSNTDNTTKLLLPDGTEVDVDESVFYECTNNLFHNEKLFHKGLVNQAHESLRLCDDSLKRLLYGNIMLAGGSSALPGFGDRLRWELIEKLAADNFKGGVSHNDVLVTPNSFYREVGYSSQSKLAAWIGGSIVGSMETYKDIKISRQEWDEGVAEKEGFAKENAYKEGAIRVGYIKAVDSKCF